MINLDGAARQIVRPQLPGERIPSYSTAQLLMMIATTSIPAPARAGATAAEKKACFEKNYGVIKKMLIQLSTNADIAAAAGLPERYVRRRIETDEELFGLSRKRVADVRRKGCNAIALASRKRFAEHKDAIILALKTEKVGPVARRYKFSPDSLKKYVREMESEQ